MFDIRRVIRLATKFGCLLGVKTLGKSYTPETFTGNHFGNADPRASLCGCQCWKCGWLPQTNIGLGIDTKWTLPWPRKCSGTWGLRFSGSNWQWSMMEVVGQNDALRKMSMAKLSTESFKFAAADANWLTDHHIWTAKSHDTHANIDCVWLCNHAWYNVPNTPCIPCKSFFSVGQTSFSSFSLPNHFEDTWDQAWSKDLEILLTPNLFYSPINPTLTPCWHSPGS